MYVYRGLDSLTGWFETQNEFKYGNDALWKFTDRDDTPWKIMDR
jgi:hypothetical protein